VDVFSISNPPFVAAEWSAPEITPKFTLGERADGVGSSDKFTEVDGELGFVASGADDSTS